MVYIYMHLVVYIMENISGTHLSARAIGDEIIEPRLREVYMRLAYVLLFIASLVGLTALFVYVLEPSGPGENVPVEKTKPPEDLVTNFMWGPHR